MVVSCKGIFSGHIVQWCNSDRDNREWIVWFVDVTPCVIKKGRDLREEPRVTEAAINTTETCSESTRR